MTHTLADGWATAKLEDICDVNPRKPPSNKLAAQAPVSFVPMAAVDETSGTIVRRESRAYAKVRNGYTAFADGDVILAKITPCFENGKAAVAKDLLNGLGFGSSEFHVLRPRAGVIAEYLFHYLRQPLFREDASAHMTGTAGQGRVPTEYIRHFEVPIPPTAEQQRIVHKVETLLPRVTAARELLGVIPRLLIRFRRAVIAAASEGELTAAWRNERASPEWTFGPLSSFSARITKGSTPTTYGYSFQSSGIPFLKVENIHQGRIDRSSIRHFVSDEAHAMQSRSQLHTGDLLFTIAGTIGSTAIVTLADVPMNTNQAVAIIRGTAEFFVPGFLQLVLQSRASQKSAEGRSRGVGMSNISLADLRALEVPVPPIDEQREAVRLADALLSLAYTVERRVTAAQALVEGLPQAILSRAFAGELVPTEADLALSEGRAFEAAELLLERLKEAQAASPATA